MRYQIIVSSLLMTVSLTFAGCPKPASRRGAPECGQGVDYNTRAVESRLFVSSQTCYFPFHGQAGDSIGVAVASTTDGFDPVIELVGPTAGSSSEFLQDDNDGCGYPHSGMTYALGQAGYHTIKVSSHQSRTEGSFQLTLCKDCDPCQVAGLAAGNDDEP